MPTGESTCKGRQHRAGRSAVQPTAPRTPLGLACPWLPGVSRALPAPPAEPSFPSRGPATPGRESTNTRGQAALPQLLRGATSPALTQPHSEAALGPSHRLAREQGLPDKVHSKAHAGGFTSALRASWWLGQGHGRGISNHGQSRARADCPTQAARLPPKPGGDSTRPEATGAGLCRADEP